MGVYPVWTYRKPAGKFSKILDSMLWKIGFYHFAKCDRPSCETKIVLRFWKTINLSTSCSEYCARLMLR